MGATGESSKVSGDAGGGSNGGTVAVVMIGLDQGFGPTRALVVPLFMETRF